MSPQTRVGPLQATVNISQTLPWFGTLALEEQAAVLDAAASRARVEAARLAVVTEARTAYLELQFLDCGEPAGSRGPGDPGALRRARPCPLCVRGRARPGGDQAPGGDHEDRHPASRHRSSPRRGRGGAQRAAGPTPDDTGRRRRAGRPKIRPNSTPSALRRQSLAWTARNGGCHRRVGGGRGPRRTVEKGLQPEIDGRSALWVRRPPRGRGGAVGPARGQRRRRPRPDGRRQRAGVAVQAAGGRRGGNGPTARRRRGCPRGHLVYRWRAG